jgi:CheY-like chemotaxis protein
MNRVLIVDDEPSILKLMVHVLRSEYSEINTESGIEALASFESCSGQIDLIVTYITMPGMSGLDLVARFGDTPQASVSGALHNRRLLISY